MALKIIMKGRIGLLETDSYWPELVCRVRFAFRSEKVESVELPHGASGWIELARMTDDAIIETMRRVGIMLESNTLESEIGRILLDFLTAELLKRCPPEKS